MAPVAPAAPTTAVTTTTTKKPEAGRANVNRTTPFSVELALAGRRAGVPLGSSKAFDIHIVDLDESGQRGQTDKDNVSDVSSILSMSPKGSSH